MIDHADFDIDEYMKLMVSRISSYNAFSDADAFMSSFLKHIDKIKVDTIDEVLKIYKTNNQCTNRARHTSDMVEVNKYLEEHRT